MKAERSGQEVMKKCLGYIGVAVLAVILAGAIICAFLGVDILFSPEGASAAVSVIGGADGPTSIFLAAKLSYGEIIRNALVTLAVGAILLTGVIVWGKKKK